MADLRVDYAWGVYNVAVDASATTFLVGQLLAYNGSAWVKADADTHATLYAKAVCLESVSAGGSATHSMPVAAEALMTDTDAPYTAGGVLYLSNTAGAITQTRPVHTSVTSLVQTVGIARTTSVVHIKINPPYEVYLPLVVSETSSGEAAFGSRTALDSGNYDGLQLNANAEHINFQVALPENFIAAVKSNIRVAADAAVAEFAVTVNSAAPSDAAHDTITADTSVSADTIGTFNSSDPITNYDLVAAGALDATNILRPGAYLNILFVHSNDTDAVLFFPGAYLVCRVV